MKILVNGHEAALKEDASFEYISENPLFTDAEDYTMDLTFPMKNCPDNILIFGALHVKGVELNRVVFNCEMRSGVFRKTGILTVISVSDVEVKAQFLEGRSAQNFNTDASLLTKLTDMDFSDYDGTGDAASQYRYEGDGWTDFPVYDITTEKVVRNLRHIKLSHLLSLTAQMAGYTVDMSALTAIPMFSHIAVANTVLPPFDTAGAMPLKSSLPEWTILELFRKTGDFFGCVVEVDSTAKRMTFTPYSRLNHSGTVQLSINDNFSVELSSVDKPRYKGNRTFCLPKESNPDNVNICPWLPQMPQVQTEDISALNFYTQIQYQRWGNWDNYMSEDPSVWRRQLFHLIDNFEGEDDGLYALITQSEDGQTADRMILRAEVINQLEGCPSDGEELDIAPCRIDFRPGQFGTLGQYDAYRMAFIEIPDNTEALDNGDASAFEIMSEWGNAKEVKHFDKLWIALEPPDTQQPLMEYGYMPSDADGRQVYTRKYEQWGYMIEVSDTDGTKYCFVSCGFYVMPYTLSPYTPEIQAYRALPTVDESKLYRFEFLADPLPDPKAIYLINGRRYACLRLTARFDVRRMSQLIKGEFYLITA